MNDNHRRVLGTALKHIDGLLVEIETAASQGDSPFARFQSDLAPVQQKMIVDHLALIRTRLVAALKALDIPIQPPRNPSSWAITTTLAFAEIAIQEISPDRLRGYGTLDSETATAIANLEADLERSLRRLRTYVARGLGRDLAARLERLETSRPDVGLLGVLGRIIRARGLVEFEGTLESLLERLETQTFEIAVFGRVSSGKSSLLNAVLGIEALPVGVTPVTAVPTRVSWGDRPEIEIHFADAPDEHGPVERLPEYVSEAANPGNSKHVVRALVRLPSPQLAAGVVFVDTPGVGSLATSGARESYAYLPRCDLGILLLDAAGSPGLEDLDILRRLYESGIPAMAVLSKADLASEPDRLRLREYVKKQIAEGLGLDLPVHLVSTVGAGAALAHEWFDREIAPLCARARELADASVRRKLAGLREGVTASLEAMLKTSPGSSEEGERERARVEELALEAEGRLQDAGRSCERLLESVRDETRPLLSVAARRIVERSPESGRRDETDRQLLREVISRPAEEARAETRKELVDARDRLREILAEMGQALRGQRVHPEELTIDLVTQPVLALPGELAAIRLDRPAWLRHFPSLLQKRIESRLLARLNDPLYHSFSSFVNHSREWLQKTLGALAARFASQSEPLRGHARRLAEAKGAGDEEAIMAELRQIEGSPEHAEAAR